MGKRAYKFDEEQLKGGTTFGYSEEMEFTFNENGLTLYFQEYRIGPYAMGKWEVTVSFDTLRDILRPDGPHRLTGFS
jgi:Protein of unknown function (DUF3298)